MASSSFFLDYWDFSVLLCLVICNNCNYDVSPINCGYRIKIEAVCHAAEQLKRKKTKVLHSSCFLNSTFSKSPASTYPNPKPTPTRAQCEAGAVVLANQTMFWFPKLNSFFLCWAETSLSFLLLNYNKYSVCK